MNWKLNRLAVISALLIGSGSTLPAQEDRSSEIMAAIFGKLQKVFNPVPEKPGVQTSFLAIANPGMPFDPSLNPKGNNNDEYLMSLFLNDAPAPNPFYTRTTNTVSGTYEHIFNFKEQPTLELPQDHAQKLKELQSLLDPEISPKRRKYDSCMYKVLDLQDAVNAAVLAGTAAGTARQKLVQAQSDWKTLGFKMEIESAQEKYIELSGKDPGSWWNGLRNRLTTQAKQTSEGISYYPTLTYPSYSEWGKDEGWSTYTLSDKEVEEMKSATQKDMGMSARVKLGLWKASVSVNVKTNTEHAKATVKGLSISMKVKGVNIYRPWLESLVFRSRGWRFNPSTTVRISDGDLSLYGQGDLPLMPMLPVRLILAKDIVFKGIFSEEEKDLFERSIKTRASLSFGPFSVSGHYNQDERKSFFSAKMTNAGIEAPGIQVIGFVCDILPKSPNPDPTLPNFQPAPMK